MEQRLDMKIVSVRACWYEIYHVPMIKATEPDGNTFIVNKMLFNSKKWSIELKNLHNNKSPNDLISKLNKI